MYNPLQQKINTINKEFYLPRMKNQISFYMDVDTK